jgi:ketosteroid isomerase-like protein
MKPLTLTLSVIAFAFWLGSCRNASDNSFTEADKEMITKTAADAVNAFKASKDLNTYVSAYYAEDAHVLMPNHEAVQGRPAIVELLKGFGDFTLDFKVNEINGSNDLAYVYGNYDLQIPTAGVKDHGKYIEIWKKQADGTWRAIYDIPNTSVPMPIDLE